MKLSTLPLVIVAVLCFSQSLYADEIYQDADGVWRNREVSKQPAITNNIESVTRGAAKSYLETMGKTSSTGSEVYQDKDGVWRNRDVKTNVNPVADGVHGFSKGLAEGVSEGLNATIGEQVRDSFKSNHPAPTTSYMKEHDAQVQHRQNMRFYQEANENKRNFSGYDQFDPAKAGEVKSEWEFFEDPR